MARIYLIGPMGSGKSTVGKSLARKHQFDFYDSDREIEARCGVDIPTIFEFEGEAGFRKRERNILAELAKLENVVIATGGGAILKPANRKLLRETGYVILLAVDLEEQLRRVALNRNRPLLQVGDVEAKLKSLMDERHSLYESTAHHVVSTNSSRMQNVVAKITRHLVREKIVEATATTRTTSSSGKAAGRAATQNGRRTATDSNPAKPARTQRQKESHAATREDKRADKITVKKEPASNSVAAEKTARKKKDSARSTKKKSVNRKNP